MEEVRIDKLKNTQHCILYYFDLYHENSSNDPKIKFCFFKIESKAELKDFEQVKQLKTELIVLSLPYSYAAIFKIGDYFENGKRTENIAIKESNKFTFSNILIPNESFKLKDYYKKEFRREKPRYLPEEYDDIEVVIKSDVNNGVPYDIIIPSSNILKRFCCPDSIGAELLINSGLVNSKKIFENKTTAKDIENKVIKLKLGNKIPNAHASFWGKFIYNDELYQSVTDLKNLIAKCLFDDTTKSFSFKYGWPLNEVMNQVEFYGTKVQREEKDYIFVFHIGKIIGNYEKSGITCEIEREIREKPPEKPPSEGGTRKPRVPIKGSDFDPSITDGSVDEDIVIETKSSINNELFADLPNIKVKEVIKTKSPGETVPLVKEITGVGNGEKDPDSKLGKHSSANEDKPPEQKSYFNLVESINDSINQKYPSKLIIKKMPFHKNTGSDNYHVCKAGEGEELGSGFDFCFISKKKKTKSKENKRKRKIKVIEITVNTSTFHVLEIEPYSSQSSYFYIFKDVDEDNLRQFMLKYAQSHGDSVQVGKYLDTQSYKVNRKNHPSIKFKDKQDENRYVQQMTTKIIDYIEKN